MTRTKSASFTTVWKLVWSFFSFYSAAENKKPQLEDGGEKKDVGKEERCKEPEPKIDNHEPRLGPRPRSHNKVLNPPGGKSSIAFY